MFRLLLTLIVVFCSTLLFAQSDQEELYYLWNKDWKPVAKARDAAYLAALKKNDSVWCLSTYNFVGPMISEERFLDRECKKMHGIQRYFHKTGFVDSTGAVYNDRREGEWTFFNDTGRAVIKKVFANGLLVSTKNLLEEVPRTDSAIYEKVEKESEFPGGLNAWQKYLVNNLKYPERALKAEVMGTVEVVFIVDKEGRITSPEIFRSVEYSLDKVTMALLQKSPAWIPATQDGKIVKSYKKQPILYRFR
jgi:periplasmic protein TonB